MNPLSISTVMAALTIFGVLAAQEREGDRAVPAQAEKDLVDRIVSGWPEKPKEMARAMIEKYGYPNELTASSLIWKDNGPWARSILYRHEVPHAWPQRHTDFLEQVVGYKVPPEKLDELAEFDGSVYFKRTKGALGAICGKEAMNFLALNLAHEIITGKRTVQDAREFYAKTAMAFMKGAKSPYTEKLLFEPQKPEQAADPDRPVDSARP